MPSTPSSQTSCSVCTRIFISTTALSAKRQQQNVVHAPHHRNHHDSCFHPDLPAVFVSFPFMTVIMRRLLFGVATLVVTIISAALILHRLCPYTRDRSHPHHGSISNVVVSSISATRICYELLVIPKTCFRDDLILGCGFICSSGAHLLKKTPRPEEHECHQF